MYSELNRTSITTLVDDFYTDIRRDSPLQPIFDGAVGTNWGPHLERMVDFWCSVSWPVAISKTRYAARCARNHLGIRPLR
jgi:hemoglobin